jgi:hypothetical protein
MQMLFHYGEVIFESEPFFATHPGGTTERNGVRLPALPPIPQVRTESADCPQTAIEDQRLAAANRRTRQGRK